MRHFESPGRSTVHAENGMVATSHALASSEALHILRQGGNAMDAALTACAVQCVVEPGSTGIGGDCFAMIAYDDGHAPRAFNGSGRAPLAASLDFYERAGLQEIPRHSAHAVTLPGSVDAWCTLAQDQGSLGLDAILAPAIRLAREGYPISPRVHWDWVQSKWLLEKNHLTRDLFLPDGSPPPVGARHRQPQLANTLERIADRGRDGFYTGPVADEFVSVLTEMSGLHRHDDLAEVCGSYVEPISADFHGHEILQCPPNAQGVTALMLLKLIESGDPSNDDPLSVDRLHQFIEACRQAYAARDAWLGDPETMSRDVQGLLDPDFLGQTREKIDLSRASVVSTTPPVPVADNTVYITVVDRDGMAVSLINSLYLNFGSGIVLPRCGVLLNNRGQGFNVKRGHPNAIDGGKRPLNTIIPAIATLSGRPAMSFGVMGGHYQAAGHAYLLSNFLELGLDLQESMDMPRIFPIPGENSVEAETTFDPSTLESLRGLGHDLVRPPRPIGGAQAIWIDRREGLLVGASDHRKDGCAIGY